MLPKTKNWRVTLLAIAIVAPVLVLFGAIIHHYQLKSEVERYKAELKAKGVLKEISQVRPPPVPFDQDGSAIFARGASLIKNHQALNDNSPTAMQMIASGKALVGATQSQIIAYRVTNSWEEARALNDSEKAALDVLMRMIDHPQVDFHFSYEKWCADPWFIPPYLNDIRPSTLLLTRAAMIDLHQEDEGAAVKETRAALSIIAAMENERLIVFELVRIYAAQLAQATTWEILQSDKASEADLAALQKDWEQQDFLRGSRQAFEMDCAMKSYVLEQWHNDDADIRKALEEPGSGSGGYGTEDSFFPPWVKQAKLSGKIFIWRYWKSYPDELRALKGQEVLRNAACYAQTNGSFGTAIAQQQAQLDALGFGLIKMPKNGSVDLNSILSISTAYAGDSLKRAMVAEAMKRMTITAIALRRYQIAHGKYPAALGELAPEVLNSIPLDPVDAKPLRYKLNPDGTFLLYSIGENGVDDGGDPDVPKSSASLSWQQGRDWVWPQPATPEEIRDWQSNKGKRK